MIKVPIRLSEIVENDISKIIQKLPNKISAGDDQISQKMLKTISTSITPIITRLINNSIREKKYPDSLKLTKIIPLYKSGDKKECSNYRPISLLSSFNKIFEKVMFNQLSTYIDRYKILFINQFGFRKFHSTIDALINTYDYILTQRRCKKKVIGIFLDLKKAFDSIDTDIFIKKTAILWNRWTI